MPRGLVKELRWYKPNSEGLLKYNVNAALFTQEGKFGVIMCIRNDRGEFLKAKPMTFHGVPISQEAEVMGLKQAPLWLNELGHTLVVLELDCLQVVEGVTGSGKHNFDLGSILSSCKNLFSLFQSYRISFIIKQANLVVHTLDWASRLYVSSYVFEFSPTCI